MFGLKDYVSVQSLEEGYDCLIQNKNNVILGGLLWMKMSRRQYHTGIDLSGLQLDRIKETPQTIEIGSMTPLGQVEKSPLLQKWYGPLFSQAFSPIVGVQFRNLATIGGSVWSRFGFSDVLTALMVLDPLVKLHAGGILPLAEFLDMSRNQDILEKIIIQKETWETCYQSQRKSATDFPVLAAAIGRKEGKWKISVGARPNNARLAEQSAALLPPEPDDDQIKAACDAVVTELTFGDNQRGSKSYRKILARVLVKRGINALCR